MWNNCAQVLMVNPSGGQLACEYGSSIGPGAEPECGMCAGSDGEPERWTAGV